MNILQTIFAPGRRPFSFIVLAYLGFLGFINLMMILPGNFISAMGHFGFFTSGDTHNLVHELSFALIVGTAAVGLLSQLWKPKENFAGQWVAMIAWGVMIILAAITNNWVPQTLYIVFGGLTILATILHPAGTGLFRWIRTVKVNRILLTLVVIATLPYTIFTLTNINLQMAEGGGTGGLFGGHQIPAFHGGGAISDTGNEAIDEEAPHDQEHVAAGHYRVVAALSLIILLVGLLASLRPAGWRFATWIAGALSILFGLTSVILPEAESSVGIVWGLTAVLWGITFVGIVEFIRRRETTYQ